MRSASIDTVSSVRETLRTATRDAHERLHNHPMFKGLATGTLTEARYRSLLAALIGFHCPLEETIIRTPASWWWGLDPQPRLRARLLVDDLAHLGFDTARVDLLPYARLPSIDSAGQLLGCLYVREGATLGGRVIARGLDPLLGDGDSGRSFFSGTPDNGRLWREVCDALETAGAAGHRHEIVDAARATFAQFETWMDGAQVLATRDTP